MHQSRVRPLHFLLRSILTLTAILSITAAVEPLGDCKIPEAVLIASDPPEGGTLCKYKNVIRLTFDSPLPFAPAAGDILIQEVLPDETLGPDLSASFLFTVEPDNKLKIKDSGFALLNLRWYAFSNSSPCDGIEDFEIRLFLLVGDVNGDGRVQNRDIAVVWSRIPTLVASDDNRADVNSDTRINFSDPPIVNPRIPAERFPMDCLPSSFVPEAPNIVFEPECVRTSVPTQVQFELQIPQGLPDMSSLDLYVGTNGQMHLNAFAYSAEFSQATCYKQAALPNPLPCIYSSSFFAGGSACGGWEPQKGPLPLGTLTVNVDGCPFGRYEITVNANLDGGRSTISRTHYITGETLSPLFGKARIFLGQAPIFFIDSTEPEHDAVLHKSRRNSVTFQVIPSEITAAHGHWSIRELLPDDQFGPELIEDFTIDYGSEGKVTLTDNGATLQTQRWYAVGNIEACDEIQDEVIHVQILIGDANGDGNVNFADMAYVNAGIPATNVPSSNPRDINNDGNINFTDLVVINAHVGESLVPKPSGH